MRPRSIRVAEMKNGWGACGPSGNVLINWALILAPQKVLEYVVVHELTHLRERSHGPRFWNVLASILPAFERPKNWLENNHWKLDDDFLSSGSVKLAANDAAGRAHLHGC